MFIRSRSRSRSRDRRSKSRSRSRSRSRDRDRDRDEKRGSRRDDDRRSKKKSRSRFDLLLSSIETLKRVKLLSSSQGLAVAVQVVIAAVIVAEIAVATVAGIVAETVVAIAVVIEVVRVAKALEMKGATGHRRQKKKLLEMLTEIETKKTMDMTIAVAVTVTRMTKMTDDQLRARDLVRDPIRVQDHDLGLSRIQYLIDNDVLVNH